MELLEKRFAAEIQKTTGDIKGDYKPLVFLFTDGEPTDNWKTVADRLLKNRHLQLIAIGCGPDTNLDTLRRITELVIVGTEANNETYAKFFKWVSSSVATASQAIDQTGNDAKISFKKLPVGDDIKVVDENTPQQKIEPNRFVFLHCKCEKTKKFYLLKFMKSGKKTGGFLGLGSKDGYANAGAFPLNDFDEIAGSGGITVDATSLGESDPCPYCGSSGWALCPCGKTFCWAGGSTAKCPWCNQTNSYAARNFSVGGGGG